MQFSRGQMQSLFFFACIICISATIFDHPNWNLVQNGMCGESVQLEDRIIGGNKASLGQYPWIARLGYAFQGTDIVMQFGCGGALINEKYVISAAHCIADIPDLLYPLLVRLGENYVDENLDCSGRLCAPQVQDIKIQAVMVPDRYTAKGFSYDISLIRLEKPADFNDFVVPVCLPFGQKFMNKNFISQSMEVAGWGVTNSTTLSTSNDLLYIRINMLPLNKCARFFRSIKLGKGQMCLGGKKNIDTCVGDSGGPLMKVEMVDGRPKYVLFGVVSFGASECGKGPAIYTDVRYYLPWILNRIRK